uniref:Uncharacterized protein n=1 Tax=Ixodes ricinus TaxID=34613 RepID=A0A6B0U8K3_IXORI
MRKNGRPSLLLGSVHLLEGMKGRGNENLNVTGLACLGRSIAPFFPKNTAIPSKYCGTSDVMGVRRVPLVAPGLFYEIQNIVPHPFNMHHSACILKKSCK